MRMHPAHSSLLSSRRVHADLSQVAVLAFEEVLARSSSLPPPTMPSCYKDHCAWLAEIRAAYDAIAEKDALAEGSTAAHPVGSSSVEATSSGASSPLASPSLAPVRRSWSEEVGEVELDALSAAFAGPALEFSDFDDPPVYRGLSSANMAGALADAVVFEAPAEEAPVFRSLSSSVPTGSAEAKWLETMPPMVRRQRAMRLEWMA